MYIRYYHVKLCIELENVLTPEREKKRKNLLNKIAFVFGLSSCFGITIVGNFQVTNVLEVHLIGAILSFFNLHIYCWLQTFISKNHSKYLYSKKLVYHIRLILCLVGSVNTILCE